MEKHSHHSQADGLLSKEKPLIGITIGDFNGVGPETILRLLDDNRILKICTPIIYGSSKILNKYRRLLSLEDAGIQHIKSALQVNHRKANVINCWEEDFEIQAGKPTPESGTGAWKALQAATQDLQEGKIHGLVTAPISKSNMPKDEFKFAGHTEYFAQAFGVKDNLMLLVSGDLRVGIVTGHIPISQVAASLTKERILSKIMLMHESLKKDFGINKPRIALLGLNPHAGENGMMGNEEIDIIAPIIKDLKAKGMLIFGPYPADGFFGTHIYKKYDGVLAMYHDQGLTPFKTLAFDDGVNYTAGLPVVRTSPDHGTAFNIAGKGEADESSLRSAVYLACDIIKAREEVKR
jgi:4-hydroxythreonine-4-phosphate dehydrogenase